MTTTAFQERVLSMAWEEVVKFLSCADYDFDGSTKCPSQCMTFVPTHYKEKKTRSHGIEKTPMYTIDGCGHSAQRISHILFNHTDPVRMSRITTLCGNHSCINPYHMEVEFSESSDSEEEDTDNKDNF